MRDNCVRIDQWLVIKPCFGDSKKKKKKDKHFLAPIGEFSKLELK